MNELKDTEIHNGLVEKELRDFFAKSIVDVEKKCKYPDYVYNDSNEFENMILRKKREIRHNLLDLERLETYKAVRDLSTLKGWNEYDISNYLHKTGYVWRNFFGTENEIRTFCKNNDIDIDEII